MSKLLVKFDDVSGSPRWGIRHDDGSIAMLPFEFRLSEWLQRSVDAVEREINLLDVAAATYNTRIDLEAMRGKRVLAPLDEQDVWAAGVTYERSREARQEEAVDGGDVYARVYSAKRPEIFFKARASWVVGDQSTVGIRSDATWNVPEPELGIVFNPSMQVVGFTIGNDMSSRDIEGENPLYLPQAKIYTASCALGPGILLTASENWLNATIAIDIQRDGKSVFADEVHTSRIIRTVSELSAYLARSMRYPDGVILLTGTGIIPPSEFTLQADDIISITIEGIGTLTNIVKVV